MLARVRHAGPAIVVWAGVIACLLGLVLERMAAALPWARFGDSLVLAIFALALAAALRRWRGWAWANALALIWAAGMVFFAGPTALLATLLVAAAACALGSLLVPRDGAARGVLALPVGLVLIGGVAGWLLPLPLFHWYLEWPLLAAICMWRAATLRELGAAARSAWQAAIAAAPGFAAGAILLLGLVSAAAWLPTMQADDLAYHLGLPSQLQWHGYYALDATQQFWALAPWLGDVVQGLVQVLAGREARGAVDLLWIGSTASTLWCLSATLRADVRTRWLVVALFASLPLLAALAGGMQTELPASALLAALALAILSSPATRLLHAGAVLAAGLVALKLGHALAALILIAWALARARGRIEWRQTPIALLFFVALAGSSYFYAWQISGNPLLPLFNEVFRSPLLASQELSDPRWHAGFSIALPWSVTFDTERYLEAWSGGFGFVLVALVGAWLLALLRAGTRGIALAASAALLLPLLPMQYARYAFPGLVLLLPPLLVSVEATLGMRWCGRIAIALCALNLAFQANAYWLLHVNALRRLVGSGGRVGEVYLHYAPERALIAQLRRRDGGESIVLALDAWAPYVAELAGRGRSVAPYAPALEAARIVADADASGARWQQLMRDVDARWLLLRPAHLTAAQWAGLARSGALQVSVIGDAELWSLPDAKPAAAEAPR